MRKNVERSLVVVLMFALGAVGGLRRAARIRGT